MVESRAGSASGFRAGEMALLMVGSGASALVYQMVWTREFRLIFGGATAATAAVLAIFTLGLGVGAHLLGAFGDRSANPLRVYARLEMGVAAGALASPWLLTLSRDAYLGLGGEAALGPVVGTFLRLALTTLVLGMPTVLMGGTLPCAVAAVGSETDPKRLLVAVLYAANTLGAVAGALVSTFVAFERLGTRRTLYAAVCLNVLVAVLAYARSKWFRRFPALSQPGGAPSGEVREEKSLPRGFVLAAAFVSGFVFFGMELVWYRMLSPILGGTVFTFGLILATVLFGIGLGGAAFWFTGLRSASLTLRFFSWTCLLEGLLILLPFAAGDRLALLAAALRGLSVFGFGGAVSGWAIVTALVVLPASMVAGFQFPLMIGLLGRGPSSVGRDTASAYVWNMAGGILGSLVGGFGAIPLLTAPGLWRMGGLTMIGLSLVASLLAPERRLRIVGPSLLALLLAQATGPTAVWRHSQIGAGRAGLESMGSPAALAEWVSMNRRSILWEADGVESSVALRVGTGVAFMVNGRVDGHATYDAPTQVMSGLLAAMLHKDPRSAMVIGLGTGGTAGWLGVVPSILRVDVSELEPRIVEVARELSAVNEGVVSNPKVQIHLGDAREFLQTTRSTYDLVVSEPSNPHRAGIASLFSREYYTHIKKRMNPGGIFLQWLQTYQIDPASVRRVFATVLAEFPHVQLFRTHHDLLILASAEPWSVDASLLEKRIREEPFARALASAWWVNSVDGFLAYYLGGGKLARLVASAADVLVTDDQNPLEFGFARSLGGSDTFRLAEVRKLAESMGELVPPGLESLSIDAASLAENRAELYGSPDVGPNFSEAARARFEARALVINGRFSEAYAKWRSQSGPPATMRQEMFIAEAQAEARDPAALTSLAGFPAGHEGEAAAVATRFFLKTGDRAKAGAEAVLALRSMTRTPWGETGLMARFLYLLPEVALANESTLNALGLLVKTPFAGGALYEERMSTWLTLSLMRGSTLDCREPLRYFEAGPPQSAAYFQSAVMCAARHGREGLVRAQKDFDRFKSASPGWIAPR